MKKKIFTLLLVLLGVLQSYASDFYDGTLYYTILTDASGTETTNVQVDGPVDASATAITIPATVKPAGESTTYNVTSIGDNAFSSIAIKSLDLSNATNLQTIGTFAFYSCTSLAGDITIPANVTSIGYGAFYNTAITSLDLSRATNLQTIGDGAFKQCTQLAGSLVIPNGVTSIGDHAFDSCIDITSVSLPTTLQTIGAYAFHGCFAVTGDISISASVTSIGDGAFANCGISNFRVAESNQNYQVQGDALLTKGGTKILAFPRASNTTSYSIPATVTEIGPYAFYNCSNLTSITAATENNITTIGENAFYGCGWYTNTIRPNNQNQIFYFGKVAYSYIGTVPANYTATIMDGTVSITANLFSYATSNVNVVSVKIPSSVTTINGFAFSQLSGLKTVDLSSATGLKTIGEYAFAQTALESITIPSGVTAIGTQAFSYCTALTTADLSQAAQLATIGGSAFNSCSNLAAVFLPNPDTAPTWGGSVFDGNADTRKFYVKDGTYSYAASADNSRSNVNAYKIATNWSTYADRICPYLPKTVTAAKIATLYLPYEVAIPSGVNAYYCSSSTSTSLKLTQLTGGVIPAETPVIVTSDNAADFNFIANGGSSSQPNDINGALKGAATDIANNTETYPYLTLGMKSGTDASPVYGFYTFTGDKITANTCHMDKSSFAGAKTITLSFDGGTTGIDAITDQTAADVNGAMKVYYDLQGRRVQNPTKGIYIVNGKKVLIKR